MAEVPGNSFGTSSIVLKAVKRVCRVPIAFQVCGRARAIACWLLGFCGGGSDADGMALG